MTTQLQQPDEATAHATIVDLHKRAFFGRLAQYGLEPQSEKEAAALLDLGVGLMQRAASTDPQEKVAAANQNFDYGEGPFAYCLQAFEQLQGSSAAPGFEGLGKQAGFSSEASGPDLPPALIDQAYDTAYQLAHDPGIYGAAVVKRAANEQALQEYAKQAGWLEEESGETTEPAEQSDG